MADLDPLIRYRKHGVDQKQKALAELYRQAEELEQQKHAIEAEMDKERQLAEAMGSAEAAAYLGRYLDGARLRLKQLADQIRKMETRIAVAQEDMRNAFAEMKKVEITQRNREDREQAVQKRKEDQELDEIAIETYRRAQDDEQG